MKRSLVRGEPSKLVGPVPVRSFPYFFFPEECELLTIEARPSLSEASASFAPVRPRRTGGYSPVTEKKKTVPKVKISRAIPCLLLPILNYLRARKGDASSLSCGIVAC